VLTVPSSGSLLQLNVTMSCDMSPTLPRFQFSPQRLSLLRSSATTRNNQRLLPPRSRQELFNSPWYWLPSARMMLRA
jgi:hypothetical protein